MGRLIASRIPPGHIDWSRIHGCKFQFQSPKPKRRCIQKCKGRVVANPCPKFSNLAKILSQTSPNPSQTFPKPFQNRIQTPPNQRKLQVQRRKQEKFLKMAPLNDWKALGAHFGGPKPPKRGPRGSQNLQNGAQNVKKSKLNTKTRKV